MPIEITESAGGRVTEIRATGRLTREEYGRYLLDMDRRIKERGKLRVLVIKHELEGWESGVLWDDAKFTLRYLNGLERLAYITRPRWRRDVAALYRWIIMDIVRYFNEYEIDKARAWLEE